ncbi:MAG: LysR substrate-binding domain-containing protein [Sphingobium sp.]
MKLSNIRDILAVVETGSLRAAGRKLNITQPTITRSIRDTENELGAMLFTRHGHGVTPTEMGRLFVRRASAIQSELRHISEEFEQAKGRFKGQVSVVMSAAASIALMPSVIKKFEKQYPESLLKFSESLFQPIEADIISGDVDFFVGPLYEETTKTSLLVEKLFDNRRMVVAREGHPLADATTLRDLQGARWIRPSFSDQHDEADFESMFERASLPPPHIAMQSRSTLLTLLGLKNSDLLTILPIQWLEFGLAGERIQQIKLSEPLQAAPVCIVRRGDLPLTPLAERLCDMIRKTGANYGLRLQG